MEKLKIWQRWLLISSFRARSFKNAADYSIDDINEDCQGSKERRR